MLPQHVLIALVAAVGAVPLNINLGAYSPALVVGDGEISLGSGGAAGASELMATLAQGAQQGATGGQQGQQGAQQGEGQQGQQGGQQEGAPAEGEAAKRAPNLARAIEALTKPEPEPEPIENAHLAAVQAATEWIKRDLNSFNAALSYAREALKDQPKVELGSEGAGVGIVVNAGVNVPAASAANGAKAPGAAERKVKRSDLVAEESESPKMTLVAITEV